MNWFSKKSKKELVAIFDIGSSSIGGALFYKEKNTSPEILFCIREFIPVSENLNSESLLEITSKTIENVAEKLSKSGLGNPSKVFCVLSSLWYVSQTRTIVLEKNSPFIFTTKIAEDLTKKEVKSFEEEHILKYIDKEKPVRLIEFKNMKTVLNGYPSSDPIGKKVSKVEMTLFLSMASEHVLEKIELGIGKYFHSSKINYSSFVLSSFSVSRDMFMNRENFLLIDIGGEITDISMIKKDVLLQSASFPFGKNYLFRSLSGLLNQNTDQVRSLFSMYINNHADEKTKETIEKSLSEIRANWLKEFEKTLVSISTEVSVPSTIFITSDDDVVSWFVETIKNEQFNQYTLTESKFKLIVISVSMLHGIANFHENVIRDRFIIIESIYINRFL